MKPRARWVKFVSWFVNTSPEWVPPDEREPLPTRNDSSTDKAAKKREMPKQSRR